MRVEVVCLGLASVRRCGQELVGSLVALQGLLGVNVGGQLRFSPENKLHLCFSTVTCQNLFKFEALCKYL